MFLWLNTNIVNLCMRHSIGSVRSRRRRVGAFGLPEVPETFFRPKDVLGSRVVAAVDNQWAGTYERHLPNTSYCLASVFRVISSDIVDGWIKSVDVFPHNSVVCFTR